MLASQISNEHRFQPRRKPPVGSAVTSLVDSSFPGISFKSNEINYRELVS